MCSELSSKREREEAGEESTSHELGGEERREMLFDVMVCVTLSEEGRPFLPPCPDDEEHSPYKEDPGGNSWPRLQDISNNRSVNNKMLSAIIKHAS